MLVLAAITLCGCASPASRIRRNQAAFDAFPVEVQENVRQGQVALDYDTDMVYIALGRPGRIYTRTTEDGSVTIWQYTGYHHRAQHYPVHSTYLVRDKGGTFRNVGYTRWVGVTQSYPFERGRVEFKDGKVSALETLGESVGEPLEQSPGESPGE